MFRTKLMCLCLAGAMSTACVRGAFGQGTSLMSIRFNNARFSLAIGPIQPQAWLVFLALTEAAEGKHDLADALAAGAQVALVEHAGTDGMYRINAPMAAVPAGLGFGVWSVDSTQAITWLGQIVPSPLENFQAPSVPNLGAVSIQVYPDRVVVLNGPGTADDQTFPGGGYPLIVALRHAVPGSDPVFGVYGAIPGDGMQIGGADSDGKAYGAHWGSVPMVFSVVGMTPDAQIGSFGPRDRMNDGTMRGGLADGRFENLKIMSRWSSCVSGFKGERFGLMRFYNCSFAPYPENVAAGGYAGFGYKWGIRTQCLGRYDVRNCTFAPVQEHCLYLDSPQSDSYFVGIQHNGSTRTAIQIVDRAFDTSDPAILAQFESGARIPQPSGFGRLLIQDVTLRRLTGDGGSGITVAGFLGDVVIRNVTAADSGPFQGAIVVWTDASENHGAYLYTGLDGHLYSTRSVQIENVNLNLPAADRSHVAVSGAEFVRIRNFNITGNRTAISLDTSFGVAQLNNTLCVIDGRVTRSSARIDNGFMDFFLPRPISAYTGFHSSGKVSMGASVLTNQQIDSTWPWP